MTTPRISVMTREQWKAAPVRAAHLSERRDLITGITFHHTTGANLGSEATDQWARNIQAYSFERGYGDIEYNAMIRAYFDPHDGQPRGVFVECRDTKYVGAHAASDGNIANRTTTGVALMGDSRDVLGHPELVATVHALVELSWYFQLLYRNAHRIPAAPQHFGHRDWFNGGHGGTATYCPGDPLETMIAGLAR